ncbi:MAG: hypothetical protein AAGA58_02465 [Verrucomicrobiota bacterium]
MSQKNQEVSVAFPAGDGWDLWSRKSGSFELADSRELDKEGNVEPFRSASHYAFPVVSVSAVPVWVSSDDPTILPGLITMHLEKLGLKPEDNSAGVLVDYKVALRKPPAAEGQPPRILVLVSVLSTNFSHTLPRQIPGFFEISPRFMILPGNHVVVWRELDRLVCAVTREDQLVYFQALASSELDAEAVREIQCLLFSLQGEGVVDEPRGMVLWTDKVAEGAEDLAKNLLGLKVVHEERPDPVMPAKSSKLVPNEVAIIRAQQKKARRIRNAALGLAALYIIGLAVFAGFYVKQMLEVRDLKDELAMIEPQVGWIANFKSEWDRHEAAVDPGRYPMELFHQVTTLLPAKGVRFVGFSHERSYDESTNSLTRDQIIIDGEAMNVGEANKYVSKVRTSQGSLEDYEWDWLRRPAADPRKNNVATFRFQGDYIYASTQE